MNPNKKKYFTQETEDAIILYNKTSNPAIQSKIYADEINYPFFKLTQNIIHTFKFYNTEVENIEDLQHELIIFLLSKLHLYSHKKNIQDRIRKIITKDFKEEYNSNFEEYVGDVDKVTQEQINNFIKLLTISSECRDKLLKLTPPKAYSYFGTIAKRWLIMYDKKNYNKKINSVPLDSLDSSNDYSHVVEENNSPSDKLPYNDKLSLFVDLFVEYCTNNIYELFPPKYDKITKEYDYENAKIADAILELFRKRDSLDIFNKKALYINIREIIDVKTPKITKVADKLKEIFEHNYVFYLEYGIIKF
jgi:hypothetical protein